MQDQELYAKIRKASGISLDEAIKTVQLKREIDSLLEARVFDELSGCSSEEEGNEKSSPMSFDKIRAEKKYQKRFKQVFDTLVDRVDGQSSSGNNSSDDAKNNGARNYKKRKFNEFNDS